MKRSELKRKTALQSKSQLKRTQFKPGNSRMPKAKKPMPQRAANRPSVPKWEKLHVLAVKSQPCACCGRQGPSDAHHCFHDRYGSRRRPNRDCIPLCKLCHQEGPHAIHKEKRSWRERHGPDHGLIAGVMLAIYGIEDPSDEQMAAHWRDHPWWRLAEIEYLTPD